MKFFEKKIKLIQNIYKNLTIKIKNEKNILIKSLNLNKTILKNYEKNIFKNFVKIYLKKEILGLYYKQIMFFNKYKFKYTYIIPLKILIEKIYNKKIEFNLVSLKYFYLNSDIFSQIITSKIRNRKNKVLRVLKSSIRKVKTPILNARVIKPEIVKFTSTQNVLINNLATLDNSNDKLDNVLDNYFAKNKKSNNLDIEENILDSIKHKNVSGV